MIVYHGTPFGGDRAGVTRFLSGRHALIPFPRQEDCETAFDVCQTVVFDNGAFTAWKQGEPITDWSGYYEWCREWCRHPAFAWAIIPDVIDGSEEDNDALLNEWDDTIDGVQVWHLHESIERLDRLCQWPRICLGSSGQYGTTGTPRWWKRMIEAMNVITDSDGKPRTRLHGLRMAARNTQVDFRLLQWTQQTSHKTQVYCQGSEATQLRSDGSERRQLRTGWNRLKRQHSGIVINGNALRADSCC